MNGISTIKMKDGTRIALKDDSSEHGSDAEYAIARMYRDLGLPMPMVREINPGDTGALGKLLLMEWANDGVPGSVGTALEGKPSYASMDDDARKEAWLTLIANGVMANSDRHGGNIMHVDMPNGTKRLAIIDNGLAMFNSGFGNNFRKDDPNSWANPRKTPDQAMWSTIGGNYNTIAGLGKDYISEVGAARAKDEMVEFAEENARQGEASSIQGQA